MGITGLLQRLKAASKRCSIVKFKEKCVGVDIYCWLHKGAFSCADKLGRHEDTNGYVIYCKKMLQLLLSAGIRPIVVFDGQRLPSKEATELKRRNARVANRQIAEELDAAGRKSEAIDYFRRCVDITPEMAHRVICLCREMSVDYIVAPYEADAQLAYLDKQGLIDLVISEDSDLMAFGCRRVLYKMDNTGFGTLIEAEHINRCFGPRASSFNEEKFRRVCILAGCDYLANLPGVGLAKAMKFFKPTVNTDLRTLLPKLPSYLKMSQLTITPEYIEQFIAAENTFLYQLVFDPIENKLVPLNPYPSDINCCDLQYAGQYISDFKAFEMAVGNIDVGTKRVVDNYTPPDRQLLHWSLIAPAKEVASDNNRIGAFMRDSHKEPHREKVMSSIDKKNTKTTKRSPKKAKNEEGNTSPLIEEPHFVLDDILSIYRQSSDVKPSSSKDTHGGEQTPQRISTPRNEFKIEQSPKATVRSRFFPVPKTPEISDNLKSKMSARGKLSHLLFGMEQEVRIENDRSLVQQGDLEISRENVGTEISFCDNSEEITSTVSSSPSSTIPCSRPTQSSSIVASNRSSTEEPIDNATDQSVKEKIKRDERRNYPLKQRKQTGNNKKSKNSAPTGMKSLFEAFAYQATSRRQIGRNQPQVIDEDFEECIEDRIEEGAKRRNGDTCLNEGTSINKPRGTGSQSRGMHNIDDLSEEPIPKITCHSQDSTVANLNKNEGDFQLGIMPELNQSGSLDRSCTASDSDCDLFSDIDDNFDNENKISSAQKCQTTVHTLERNERATSAQRTASPSTPKRRTKAPSDEDPLYESPLVRNMLGKVLRDRDAYLLSSSQSQQSSNDSLDGVYQSPLHTPQQDKTSEQHEHTIDSEEPLIGSRQVVGQRSRRSLFDCEDNNYSSSQESQKEQRSPNKRSPRKRPLNPFRIGAHSRNCDAVVSSSSVALISSDSPLKRPRDLKDTLPNLKDTLPISKDTRPSFRVNDEDPSTCRTPKRSRSPLMTSPRSTPSKTRRSVMSPINSPQVTLPVEDSNCVEDAIVLLDDESPVKTKKSSKTVISTASTPASTAKRGCSVAKKKQQRGRRMGLSKCDSRRAIKSQPTIAQSLEKLNTLDRYRRTLRAADIISIT